MPVSALEKQQREFDRIHDKGDLLAAVRVARHAATSVLRVKGLETDVVDIAKELTGDIERRENGSVEWFEATRHMFAAFVMGIALGQLVSPDVFAESKGGAR